MNKCILLLSAFIMISLPVMAQEEEGKYHIGHETKLKEVIPGLGMIKGSVHALHYLEHLPESVIDITDGRMVEVDKHGHFEFEVDAGTHKMIVSHKGFKSLVIEKIVITEGHETHINIGLVEIMKEEKKE